MSSKEFQHPDELKDSDLYKIFMQHKGRLIHKHVLYFHAYEKHFARFRNKPITFLEIGVSAGGSVQMWKKYFGAQAKIVGIDINPDTKFQEEQIAIRIGSQDDPVFLKSVIDEFGPFDIILDDGSHVQKHITTSFECLYPFVKEDGVYFVEDLHTSYWPEFGGGLKSENQFIEYSKKLLDPLNGCDLGIKKFDSLIRSVSFYPSIVVFEKPFSGAHNTHPGQRMCSSCEDSGVDQSPVFYS